MNVLRLIIPVEYIVALVLMCAASLTYLWVVLQTPQTTLKGLMVFLWAAFGWVLLDFSSYIQIRMIENNYCGLSWTTALTLLVLNVGAIHFLIGTFRPGPKSLTTAHQGKKKN